MKSFNILSIEKQQKYLYYHQVKLINMSNFWSKSNLINYTTSKITYSPLSKAFEKQIKTIENQGEKSIKVIEKYGKQLVESKTFITNYDYYNEKNTTRQKETLNDRVITKRRDER